MGVCKCSECLLWTYQDLDGKRRRGREVDQQTILGHLFAQKQKRKLEQEAIAQAEDLAPTVCC